MPFLAFPVELRKIVYQYRPGRSNLTGKINGWKQILNAFSVHYGDWFTAAAN